jgi:hypothetical protein
VAGRPRTQARKRGEDPANLPTRAQRRERQWSQRIADAETPQKRVSAAFGWFLSSLTHVGTRNAPQTWQQEAAPARMKAIADEVTEYLARKAREIDKG